MCNLKFFAEHFLFADLSLQLGVLLPVSEYFSFVLLGNCELLKVGPRVYLHNKQILVIAEPVLEEFWETVLVSDDVD